MGGLTDPTSYRLALIRSQKARKIFILERLLGRTMLDYINLKLIFLEAQLRRRQTSGSGGIDKKIKVRTVNSAPLFGKVIEEYYKTAMDRIMAKLIYTESVEEKDWLWSPNINPLRTKTEQLFLWQPEIEKMKDFIIMSWDIWVVKYLSSPVKRLFFINSV